MKYFYNADNNSSLKAQLEKSLNGCKQMKSNTEDAIRLIEENKKMCRRLQEDPSGLSEAVRELKPFIYYMEDMIMEYSKEIKNLK